MHGERSFKAALRKEGGRCFLLLPFDPDEAWGPKARYHVAGTVHCRKYRGEVVRVGEALGLVLGPAWLRDNDVDLETEVEVVLGPEGPQSGSAAADLAAAFKAEPRAVALFDSLPTFYRNNFMRWIDSAKRPETRAARIRDTIGLLKEGKRER